MTPDTQRHAKPFALAAVALWTFLPLAAHAYVGPGAGLGLLAALWGLVAAVGVAVLYVVMWPIRRMRRRRKAEQAAAEKAAQEPAPAQKTAGDTHPAPARRSETESMRH